MPNHMSRFVQTLLFVVLGTPATLVAQLPDEAGISAFGTVTVTCRPERLRLQVDLLSTGKDLNDALNKLTERIQAARARLSEFGVDETSVKVGEPKISSRSTNSQQQMERMVMQRMRGRKTKRAAESKPPITVSATLKAEWALKSEDGTELLREVHPLQERIKAADLSGSKEPKELTPEQEEMLEEMEDFRSYSTSGEFAPGDPVFLFVARITDQQRAQAEAEAFRKAREQAARLAKAAGAQLGPVRNLSTLGAREQAYSSLNYSRYGGGHNSAYIYSVMQHLQQNQDSAEPNPNEAIGFVPGPIRYPITISASFSIK